jgi:hypothetical protein
LFTSAYEKRPDVFVTPRALGAFRPFFGRVSQAQRRGGAIRAEHNISQRGIACPNAFLDRTRSYEQHGSHVSCIIRKIVTHCPRALSATGIHPFRRRPRTKSSRRILRRFF